MLPQRPRRDPDRERGRDGAGAVLGSRLASGGGISGSGGACTVIASQRPQTQLYLDEDQYRWLK